jgi:hypothetical protein
MILLHLLFLAVIDMSSIAALRTPGDSVLGKGSSFTGDTVK